MKVNNLIIALLLLLSSCNVNNNTGKLKQEFLFDSITTKNQILDTQIKLGIEELKKDYPDLHRHVIAVYFTDSESFSEVIKADSLVVLSYYDSKADLPQECYKGYFEMDSTSILIFDRDNIGLRFYDSSVLNTSQTINFNKSSLNVMIIIAYIIKNDSLIQWIAP
jgi:uncharacterized phage-like protein YoqJ